MSFIRLNTSTTFDEADGEGILLDRRSGRYFQLNAVATLMLKASLQFDEENEIISFLKGLIDADDEQLSEGLSTLRNDLASLRALQDN